MRFRITALTMVVLSVGACSPTAQSTQKFISEKFVAPYAEIPVSESEQGYIDKVMVDTLRDPNSVQYRSVRATRAQMRSGPVSTVICGMVNATNGFGGYTGFQPFFIEVIDGKTSWQHNNSDIYTVCQGAGIPIG